MTLLFLCHYGNLETLTGKLCYGFNVKDLKDGQR